MELGIIGLPRSGKTTIFNAVTRGNASVSGYSNKSNMGIAKVLDPRLDDLASLYKPKKVVQAEITYIDVPSPPEGVGENVGISGDYLNTLQSVDALVIIVRAFGNPAVPHIHNMVDHVRDTEDMIMEMILSDLGILDRRLVKISENLKGVKPQEREMLMREQELLKNVKSDLESGLALKDQGLPLSELKRLRGYGLLSIKPMIIVINVDDQQLGKVSDLEDSLTPFTFGTNSSVTAICGQLEMELVQMNVIEESEFRKALGIDVSGLNKMVRLSYDVLNQICFFTVGEDEVRAWEIPSRTEVQKAAGRIHTDLERGFIRAEIIPYADLMRFGGFNSAKRSGVVRQEGKGYIVEDGEVMQVLFNV